MLSSFPMSIFLGLVVPSMLELCVGISSDSGSSAVVSVISLLRTSNVSSMWTSDASFVRTWGVPASLVEREKKTWIVKGML